MNGSAICFLLTGTACLLPLLLANAARASEPLVVPAFTAYIEPEPDALKVSTEKGVSGWTNPEKRVVWHGYLKAAGKLELAVLLRLPQGSASKLRLTVAGKPLTAEAKGTEDGKVTVDFGSVEIPAAGYYSFALEGLEKDGKTFGEITALRLGGPAIEGAEFNLKPRRNAASVHLGYPLPKDAKVRAFYGEVTVRTVPLWSYYEVCGFHRGYFGIQVNSPTERRIIFSLWDSGGEAVDRKKVKPEDLVQLVEKGEGVVAGSFGNEGTGGHSHMVYHWEKDQTYRFLVTVRPEGPNAVYSGYFFFPEKKAWGLIASFRAPKDKGMLDGLYSFNENFGGANGDQRRLAEFGRQWVQSFDGAWTELLTARFTHDPTGKDRRDRGAGLVEGRFFLTNGGFVGEPTKYGELFQRPAAERPTDLPAEKDTAPAPAKP